MPQHDLDIANGSGAAVRADINGALAALGSTMKGPNAPPAPVAGMMWVEDDNPSSTRWTVRMFDGADWIAIGILDANANRFEPANALATSGGTLAGNLTVGTGGAGRVLAREYYFGEDFGQDTGIAYGGDGLLNIIVNGAARCNFNALGQFLIGDLTVDGAISSGGALVAPRPQAAAGVGQFVPISQVGFTTYNLPPGGTWVYSMFGHTASNAVSGYGGGFAAGGTQVFNLAGVTTILGWAWRIA